MRTLTWIRRTGGIATCLALCMTASAARYEVRLPANPKPYEAKAKSELTLYLDKVVRNSLTVDGQKDVVFHIGDTAFARAKGLAPASLKDEQWVVKSFGRDVVLVGGGTRGTLYAVSHFLEDCCGVRWWSPIEEDVPAAFDLAFDKLDFTGCPAFPFRDIHADIPGTNASEIACRLRLNGLYSGNGKNPADFGGWMFSGSPSHCHTLDRYIPADSYLKEHPEWFSYVREEKKRCGGQRGGQLCYTNPEVRRMMQKRLREYIERDRAMAAKEGVPPPTIYEISENDNTRYCECDDCLAARKKWNLSGLNLDFVNEIASAVEDDYPNVMVRTFAYEGSEEPPKGGIRAADNVMVRLCDTKSNMVAGMFDKGNTTLADFLEGWSKSAKHLAVWDYSINFTKTTCGLPMPTERHYGEYFRACRKYGVYSFFWQHECAWTADMWELKYFLECKLMENPSLDNDALIAQFMREYYGPAAPEIAAYRQRLDAVRRAKNGCVKWFPQLADFDWIGADDIAAFQQNFEDAETAAKGVEPWLSRVRRARLGVDRLVCQRERTKDGEIASAEGRAAEARIRAFWPEWAKRYAEAPLAKVADEIGVELGLPKPAKFANVKIVDFPASSINLMALDGHMKVVDDPKSETGRSVRIDAEKGEHYDLPFGCGLFDKKQKNHLLSLSVPREKALPGYGWYEIGTSEVTPDSYVWLTRGWLANVQFSKRPELHGRRFTFWISVRFSGKKFTEGSSEHSYIWIDRLVLVPSK